MADKLPKWLQRTIRSTYLKEEIQDDGMWSAIPGVDPRMDSAAGLRRLRYNATLFTFIDRYFPDGPFGFEPNMADGRFMFIPYIVRHQGMGICVSEHPGWLEVGHFWYPSDYTTNPHAGIGAGQIYVPMFLTNQLDGLAAMVRDIYFDDSVNDYDYGMCTFPFFTDCVVTLHGPFMDDVAGSCRKVREALRDRNEDIRRNGEGLCQFMERMDGLA